MAPKIIREVCQAIYDALSPIYFRARKCAAEWKHISEYFKDLLDIPHVVGAVDGKTYSHRLA